jgi:negative regulator of replication initiation
MMSASHMIALLLAFSGAELAAQAPAADANASAPAAKTEDAAASSKANRMICRSVEVLGSRLKANKVCMTSSEWAEQRRVDRMSVDGAQRVRGTQGN